MNYITMLQSIGIGFCIGAMVGPIAILCIRRTIKEGFWVGLAAGVGVALADGIYSAIALWGVATLQTILNIYHVYLQLLLGAYLFYLGVEIIYGDTKPYKSSAQQPGLMRATVSTFFLTIANPMTILAFFTIFSSTGIIAPTLLDVLIGSACVMIGSALWWTLLAGCCHQLRAAGTSRLLTFLNAISGYLICLFGVIAILDAMWALIKSLFFFT